MKIGPSVRAAWGRNLEVNRALVGHLTPEMLGARTPGGGFSVAQHLSHIVGVTKFWGGLLDPERLSALPDLYDPDGDSFEDGSEMDPKRILDVLEATTGVALAAAEARPQGSDALPHTDADAYLVHMIVHDAHHRGQILPALKTSSFPLPDEDALWASWRSRQSYHSAPPNGGRRRSEGASGASTFKKPVTRL